MHRSVKAKWHNKKRQKPLQIEIDLMYKLQKAQKNVWKRKSAVNQTTELHRC